MRYAKPLIVSAIALAAMFAASVYAAGQLGDRLIPIHWGASGAPNGYAPASTGVYLLPGIGLIVTLGLALLPPIMPRRGRLERSWAAYETLWLAMLGFFFLMHGAMLGVALGYPVPMVRVIVIAVGLLIAVIGNLLGKVRYNYVFGIRTPWTLANERVWDRTHRFAGWLMVLGGGLCALVGLLTPRGAEPSLIWLVIPCAVGPALAATVYSAIESRREEQGLGGQVE